MRTDLGFKRIATEEAFVTKEIAQAYRDLLARNGSTDIGFNSLMGYYLNNPSERTRAVAERLEDLGQRRIADMDATGIDMQILSLTSPGVQIFDADAAVGLARSANDELAEAIAKHPTRYTGLAAIAPQNPSAAAKELERAVQHARSSKARSSIRTRTASIWTTRSSGTSSPRRKRSTCRSTSIRTRRRTR